MGRNNLDLTYRKLSIQCYNELSYLQMKANLLYFLLLLSFLMNFRLVTSKVTPFLWYFLSIVLLIV